MRGRKLISQNYFLKIFEIFFPSLELGFVQVLQEYGCSLITYQNVY